MGTVVGLLGGAGAFLVWWAFWVREPQRARAADGWSARTQDLLVQAGAPSVTPGALVGSSVVLGGFVAVVSTGTTGSAAIAACFGAIVARAPFALVQVRANARRTAMREVWPDAVDNLASAIRAGLSLPEALAQLGERGPEPLRASFRAFAQDYRTTGKFADCLDALKARLADPVGDRIIESLRITREVGGSDVGRLLRTLSGFLREDARTRGELEARQSWTVNAARLAVAAPWVVLALLATRPESAAAYNSAAGVTVLIAGAASTIVAYRIMMRVGRLPVESRVLR